MFMLVFMDFHVSPNTSFEIIETFDDMSEQLMHETLFSERKVCFQKVHEFQFLNLDLDNSRSSIPELQLNM